MTLFDIARISFALLAVLGMIGGLALLAKRFGLAQTLQGRADRRLRLVETLALDAKRRAAILSCDGREHLVILDAAGVTLIERNFGPDRNADNSPPSLRLVRPADDSDMALRSIGAI